MSDSSGGGMSDLDDMDDIDMIMQQLQSEQEQQEAAERDHGGSCQRDEDKKTGCCSEKFAPRSDPSRLCRFGELSCPPQPFELESTVFGLRSLARALAFWPCGLSRIVPP
ncbi:hypothetical protein Tco_0464500 [Tanacetum coccineum]